MMRIIALNEDSQESSNEENEIKVTREAQETIAVSEYLKALNLKKNGNIDDALFLFSELLETEVLNDVTFERKEDKIFSVKYNCYRNISFIYEEKNENIKALQFLIKAMELDDTDVFTMSKLGQLALKLKQVEIAKTAFDKCLLRNPNHWPSIDGILQVFCLSENILDAYGWALHWYNIDDTYERAHNVLTEISEKFKFNLPFYENVFKGSFKADANVSTKESNFPPFSLDETIEDFKPLNIDYREFKMDGMNWLTLGKFIIKLYKHLEDNNNNLCSTFDFNDFLNIEILNEDVKCDDETAEKDVIMKIVHSDESDLTEPGSRRDSIDELGKKDEKETSEISENEFVSPSVENILSVSDSVGEDKNEIITEQKPKARRRGSELSILEQWGWHKTRRRKKCEKSESTDLVDTTINGFLRKIFAVNFEENFDNTISPFEDDELLLHLETNTQPKMSEQQVRETEVSLENFQKKTEKEFEILIDKLKERRFDLFIPIELWLNKISLFWNQLIPKEICSVYLEIYELYLKHYDIQNWNILEFEEFSSAYRMMLFYLELEYERVMEDNTKSKISSEFRMKMLHLMAYSGFSHSVGTEENRLTITRLIWVHYNISILDNDSVQAIACISNIEDNIKDLDFVFEMILPNQQHNNHFNLHLLKKLKAALKRKQSLSNVKTLYDDQKYEQLELILKDSLINSTEIKTSENTSLKIQIQFEVLLESLWQLGKPEECLIWAEKCLKYSLDQYFAAPIDTHIQTEWAESVNFILIYMEAIINDETNHILRWLNEKQLSRLIQNLTKIVVNQLDTPYEKNNTQLHKINLNIPWIILYHILQREEDKNYVKKKKMTNTSPTENGEIEDNIPNTITLFFTAHDFLGRRSWCSKDDGKLLQYILNIVAPQLRSPVLEPACEIITEYIEQITYCLYGYPAKRARVRHIEEHDATNVDLTWERAIQLFDIYRPDNLPEFNAYKYESITAEMEQLLNKILLLIPNEYDPTSYSDEIRNFINGVRSDLPEELSILPSRISCIYFLLADYYFKNREFTKTIKFYILDLTLHPTRFDSWAGLALSKATNLETKLNSCNPFNANEVFTQCEETLKCFEQCIKFNKNQTVWIEYGTFAYSMHAFCSRNLKQNSHKLSMERFAFVEEKKEECINIANNCFETVNREIVCDSNNPEESQHDEKWLYHYMLGKISEKKKNTPAEFLSHYVLSAKYLYENKATYPFKINHNNPQNLSIEALEIFYRISATIMKYLEQHNVVQRDIGKLFHRTLKDLATSPFALNQAKIDDTSINALKRKLNPNNDEITEIKTIKLDSQTTVVESENKIKIDKGDKTIADKGSEIQDIEIKNDDSNKHLKTDGEKIAEAKINFDKEKKTDENVGKPSSPNRRGSQESSATTTTNTSTGNSSSTSSSSSSESSGSDSSSSDSDSDSSSDEESNQKQLSDDTPYTESELESIYKICVKNFEECITRFPEHYKSIYRLVNFYLNGPLKTRDFEKAKQLLLGTYKTTIGNTVQGLFVDRKINNFFNGIWRIPSSEIDRPGSFSSHLSKCVIILMEILKESHEYSILLDLAQQLQRTPEPDKRYLKDSERKDLFLQAISFSKQIFRSLLKKHVDGKNPNENLNLLIEIYKTHRKCIKNMQQKEGFFNSLIIETYKAYTKDRIKLPETGNGLELAVKLCHHEINFRKNLEKQGIVNPTAPSSGAVGYISDFALGLQNISKTPFRTSSTPPTTTICSNNVTTVNTVTKTIAVSSLAATPILSPIISPTTITSSPTATSTASNSITNKQRNRQSSSKSTGISSTSPSLRYSNPLTDSSMIATMLAMYPNQLNSSMPQFTDPNLMSSLMADYYTQLGSSGSRLGGFSMNSVSPLQQPPIQSTACFGGLSNIASRLGGFSMNSISSLQQPSIQSTANTITSKNQNNLGNQLTITTSSMKDHSGVKTIQSDYNRVKQQSKTSSQSSNVFKKEKLLQDMKTLNKTQNFINQAKSLNILHDLPKSLSITPSTITFNDKNDVMKKMNQIKTQEISKQKEYAKYKQNTSKKPSSNTNMSAPYNRNLTKEQLVKEQLAKLSAQYPLAGIDMQEYNRQLQMFSTYADVLNLNSGLNMPSQHAGNSIKNQQQQYKKPQQSTSVKSNIPNIGISAQNVSKTPPIGNSGYMKTHSPILNNSPTKSPILASNIPRQNMTPPISIPPQTKTLQQKLAEQKQKANAHQQMSASVKQNDGKKQDQNKKSSNKSNDVIVLE